ncbi:hypothetical protein STPL106120_09245 [Streptococcus pluranimalium]|uniref:hypothetical protein n=1 Tax=Streptococcus pluranimalium TaxID=82348 RepID=UPI0039EC0A61
MFDKWKTIRLLKSKRQSVLIYFDSDYVYLIKTGMFKNICYRLIVPELLKDILMTYALDGSYILYKGQIASEVVNILLQERFKWQVDSIYEVE